MDKKQFTKRVQEQFKGKVTADMVAAVVGFVFDEIVNVLAEREEVQINRLGRFYPLERGPKTVKTTITGKGSYEIPARWCVGFKPTPLANETVNKGRPRHSGADLMDRLR